MRLLSRILLVLFLLIAVLIALSNAQPVQLALWPLPQVAVMPLYVLLVGLLLAGVLMGLALGWWAGRHHRRRAREHGNEAVRLDREVTRLREALVTRAPAPSNGAGASADSQGHKALERQRALVAPDLMPPARSGPLA